MKKVWKVGPTARSIYSTLSQILRVVENSPDVHLNEEFLSYVHVRKEDWDLTDTDEFFACMKTEDFVNLTPSEPLREVVVPYEDIEYPTSTHILWMSNAANLSNSMDSKQKTAQRAKTAVRGLKTLRRRGTFSLDG